MGCCLIQLFKTVLRIVLDFSRGDKNARPTLFTQFMAKKNETMKTKQMKKNTVWLLSVRGHWIFTYVYCTDFMTQISYPIWHFISVLKSQFCQSRPINLDFSSLILGVITSALFLFYSQKWSENRNSCLFRVAPLAGEEKNIFQPDLMTSYDSPKFCEEHEKIHAYLFLCC